MSRFPSLSAIKSVAVNGGDQNRGDECSSTLVRNRHLLQILVAGISPSVPESPVFSSGSREDPPLVSTSKVAQTQLWLFWALCRRQARFTSSRPCIIARLPDYPAGMVRESSGVIKGLLSSIGKPKLSKYFFDAAISVAVSWSCCHDHHISTAARIPTEQLHQFLFLICIALRERR